MTREEYLDILAEGFEAGRAKFVELVLSLPADAFLVQAAAAWDRARVKYGPECHLDRLDLLNEAAKEAIDGVSYLSVAEHFDKG